MYLAADRNLADRIYEAGVGTGGIAGNWLNGALMGWSCGAIEQDAMKKRASDLKKDIGGDFIINIVGFSRGGVEALDFANQVESSIQQGKSDFAGAQIGFLGLYDPVDSINASRDNAGGLNITVPTGIAHVADAVALSENRSLFDWINLIGSPNTTVIGFMGAHSDIGGGYANDPISEETLSWMTGQAKAAGMVFTSTFPPAVFTAADIHDSWRGASGEDGGLYPFPTAPVERKLPVGLMVYTSGGPVLYGTKSSSFWNPDFAGDESFYNSLSWGLLIA